MLVTVSPENGLLPNWYEAIFLTNSDLSSLRPPESNPYEISIYKTGFLL